MQVYFLKISSLRVYQIFLHTQHEYLCDTDKEIDSHFCRAIKISSHCGFVLCIFQSKSIVIVDLVRNKSVNATPSFLLKSPSRVNIWCSEDRPIYHANRKCSFIVCTRNEIVCWRRWRETKNENGTSSHCIFSKENLNEYSVCEY